MYTKGKSMNINFSNNIYNTYLPAFKQKRKNKADIHTNTKPEKSIFNKTKNLVLAGIISCTALNTCNNNRITDTEKIDGINVQYFDVKQETKDSVLKPVVELKSKLCAENDFLEDMHIDITKNYDELDDNNSFRSYLKKNGTSIDKGNSFYSDKKLSKRIAVIESAHNSDKIINWIKNRDFSAVPAMRHTLMHETGHQFDKYFGHNHDADFALKYDSLLEAREKNPGTNPFDIPETKKDQKTMVYFKWNSGLSDKPEFQKAMLKDLKHIAKVNKETPDELPTNIEYFLNMIDLNKEINERIVDLADVSRSEVYANLFSYAIGEDDGNKKKFVNNFKHCYKIVQNDIKEKLNLDIKDCSRKFRDKEHSAE